MTRTLLNRGRWLLLTLLLGAAGWWLLPQRFSADGDDAREEIVLWHFWGGADLDVVRDVVARFNAAQPKYRVREIAIPGNNLRAKLFLSAKGGAPPDLVNIDDPVAADWTELGVLQTVDAIVGEQQAASIAAALLPAARELSSSSGRLVGICNGLDVRALYYNQSFLEEQGWSPPRTLEELDQLAEQVRGLGLDQPRFAFLPSPRRILFFAYLFGATVWDEQHAQPLLAAPEVIAAGEWLQSYSRRFGEDDVAAYRQTDQSLPGKSFPLLPQTSAGMVGRYVFSLDGQWRVRDLRAFRKQRAAEGLPQPEFGVIPFPPPHAAMPQPAAQSAGWVNGNVFVFPRGARNSAGAVEFAKFWIGLTNPAEGSRTALAGGWLPVTPAVVAEPEFAAELERDPLFRQFVTLAGSAAMRPTPSVRGAGYLVRVLEATAERVAGNTRLSAAEALQAANREVEAYLRGLPRPASGRDAR